MASDKQHTSSEAFRRKARRRFEQPVVVDLDPVIDLQANADAAAEVRRIGMSAWAYAAAGAMQARSRAMIEVLPQPGGRYADVSLSELMADEAGQIAIDVVDWLARLFRDGRVPQGEELALLRQVQAAVRPQRRPHQIELLAGLIVTYAEALRRLPLEIHLAGRNASEQALFKRKRHELANSFAVEAWAIHEGFDSIVPIGSTIRDGAAPTGAAEKDERLLDRLVELLGLYEPTKAKNTKGSAPAKLGEFGILEELNTMAGWPLERTNANALAEVVRRERKARANNK